MSLGGRLPTLPSARPGLEKIALEQRRGAFVALAVEGAPMMTTIRCRSPRWRARHDVVAGRAGVAGLHAVDAGIAAEQAVVVVDEPAAERAAPPMPNRSCSSGNSRNRARPIIAMSRAELTCGRDPAGRWDCANCDSCRPSLRRVDVHLVGEGLDRARDAFGDRHRDVVRRLHHQHLQGVVERHQRAGPEPHLRGRHAGRAGRDPQRRVERDLPSRTLLSAT